MTFIHALALALLLRAPPDLEQIVRERAAAHGVDGAYLVRVVGCESGWNVRAVGSLGELGLAQLAPFGLLPHFYHVGYDDPFNATQSVDYLARAVSGEWWSQGVGAWQWSCA